ncbi:MAG TPA: MATE family efflux transporter, partial [Gemmatimonadales bacterium]|nr:MATE family efflux transporter [Gemmatimonadales bacterium]
MAWPAFSAGRPWPRRKYLRATVRLALPVVVIQVGMMTMGVVDTVMVGHVSAQALAAVALGNLYFFGLAIFAMGTLMVLDPVVAQAVGAHDEPAIARGIQRGVLLAVLLSIPAALLLLAAGPFRAAARQPADVVPSAAAYAVRLAPGVLPFFVFVVFRQSLQAMQRTRPIVIAIVVANLANACLNWVLIFGRLGAPALGVAGSAWATTASRWLLAALLLLMVRRRVAGYLWPIRREVWEPAPLGRMLRLGIPIGCQVVLEFGAFA